MLLLLCELLMMSPYPLLQLVLLLNLDGFLCLLRLFSVDSLLEVLEEIVDLSLPCIMFLFDLPLIS